MYVQCSLKRNEVSFARGATVNNPARCRFSHFCRAALPAANMLLEQSLAVWRFIFRASPDPYPSVFYLLDSQSSCTPSNRSVKLIILHICQTTLQDLAQCSALWPQGHGHPSSHLHHIPAPSPGYDRLLQPVSISNNSALHTR